MCYTEIIVTLILVCLTLQQVIIKNRSVWDKRTEYLQKLILNTTNQSMYPIYRYVLV